MIRLFHYPPYVSGMWEVEYLRVFCPLFEKYGVDVVFTRIRWSMNEAGR